MDERIGGIKERDVRLIRAFAKANMNATKAAEIAYMHRNTLVYHLNKIRDRTGFNPFEFDGLMTLLGYVEKIPCAECKFHNECIRMIETIHGDRHIHNRVGWCSKGERD